jgi:predicted DNA-binding ribbon-helix-helix protein
MLVKKSFSLAGHRTSVALEAAFWDALAEMAAAECVSLAALVMGVDGARDPAQPLASALRVAALAAARAHCARPENSSKP